MKKNLRILSLLAFPLVLTACGGDNSGENTKQITHIEACYVLDGSTEEKTSGYDIQYGQNFQNVEVKVYAFYNDNQKVAVQPKSDEQPDGFTYRFTSGTESDFFSLKPPVGYYSTEFSYQSHTTMLSFNVTQSDVAPQGATLVLGDFDYSDEGNPTPAVSGFPEEITYIYFEYAAYDESGKIGDYMGYFEDTPIVPGKYSLKATINSKSYLQVTVTKDFNVRKGNFPSNKYELAFDNDVLVFTYAPGKNTYADYQLFVPQLKDKTTGDISFDSNAQIRWSTPTRNIEVGETPTSAYVIYSSDLYKDYTVQVQVKFSKLGVIPPYNFGFKDEDGVIWDSVNYDGQPHTVGFDTSYTEDEQLPFHIVGGESTLTATNAGEYTVTFALNEPEKTYWADETSSIANKSFTFRINSVDLIPNYASAYKLKLGDMEFAQSEGNDRLEIPYGTDVANKEFKLMVLKNGQSEYEEYPATFTNYEWTSEELNIVNNVLQGAPAHLKKTSTLVVDVGDSGNYYFQRMCEVVFYPSTELRLVLDKTHTSSERYEEYQETYYFHNIYFACIHTNDLDTDNGILSVPDDGGFGFYFEDGGAYSYSIASVSNVSLTLSKVSAYTQKLICYALDKDTYLSRLDEVNRKVEAGESIELCDKPEVGDIQLEYDFSGGPAMAVDTEYTFDFTPLADQFLATKPYVLCFFFQGDGVHAGDTEVSQIVVNCVRTAYC